MKVAIIAGEIPPMTFIQRLVYGLAKQNIELLVMGRIKRRVVSNKNIHFIGEKKYLGNWGKFTFRIKYKWMVRIFRHSEFSELKKFKNDADSLDFALIWYKPDVVHVQWAKSLDSLMWVNHFGIKLLLSLRGAHINYSPITVEGLAENYQRNFPKVHGFHGVSQAICREATKYGADINRCNVIYSGFNLNQFSKGIWKNDFQSLPKRTIKIISVGRTHWKKGYHIALDAMKLLKDADINFHYTIIGALGDEELLFQKSQLLLDEVIDFIPNVSFDKVKEMISGSDVFLLPSVEEGIANVVIEAMLLGTVVITTDCGGMTETVTHGQSGWVVPVRKPEAIAQAIMEIKNTSPKILEDIILAARQQAEEQHNESLMVEEMLQLYHSVLSV